jgi:hypothetical protein
MFLLLVRGWSCAEAAQVATSRINHCLVDLMNGDDRDGVAEWLFSSQEFRVSLKRQLEAAYDESLCNVSKTSLNVLDEFIYAGLEIEIINEYYPTLVFLLHATSIRAQVIDILLALAKPKNYMVTVLLKKGYVDVLFNMLTKIRMHATIDDICTHMFEIEPLYNISTILNIVNTFNDILSYPKANIKHCSLTVNELVHLIASVFSLEHIDIVKYVHQLLCQEIQICRLNPDVETDLIPLVDSLYSLLTNIKNIHVQANSGQFKR